MTLKEQVVNALRDGDGIRMFYLRHLQTPHNVEQEQWRVRCPFHDDTNPSLSVNSKTGLFSCFGCGAHGDIFGFRMRIENLDYTTCLSAFASELNIDTDIPSGATRKVPTFDQIEQWSNELFSPSGRSVKEFLNVKRGLRDDTLHKFRIGLDSSTGSISIPVLGSDPREILQVKFIKYDLSTGKKSIRSIGKAGLLGIDKLNLGGNKPLEIVVAEGELDALVLNQEGFTAVSGTGGALTWKPEWAESFKGQHVVVCFDSDDTGRRGATKVVESVSKLAATVRVVDIYGGAGRKEMKDITDFFVKQRRTADALRSIISNSSVVDQHTTQKSQVLQLLESQCYEIEVCPAQDYVNGVFYYAVQITGKPYLVTSNRECFSFAECAEHGVRLRRGEVDKFRFSIGGLRSFLQGEPEVNPQKIFEKTAAYIRRYIVFKDPDCFAFLTLWIMGTYVFRAFRYYPYIHLIGEKQSGKTLLMDILAPIAFNGELSTNATEAVLFRDIQNNQLTLFLDEVERFRSEDRERYGAVMDILKSGYSRSGLVKRCGGKDKDKIHSFLTYSPKVLAGINEIDDVLRDRTIRIQMLRRLPSEPVERYRENKASEEIHCEIRDDLYKFGLTSGPKIAGIYQNNLDDIDGLEHLSNREYDIWAPIVLLANCVSAARENRDLIDMAIRFSKRKISEHGTDDISDNTTSKLLVGLNAVVQEVTPIKEDQNTLTYDTESVFKFFKSLDEFSWLEKKPWLTRNLRRVDVQKGTQKVIGKATRVYVVDKRKLRDLTERYAPGENASVTVTETVTTEYAKG